MAKTKKAEKRVPSSEARLEFVPLSAIKVAKRNPKRHDLEAIKASIRRFGFVAPLVEDAKTGRLVAGHGRLEALMALEDEAKQSTPPGTRWAGIRDNPLKPGEWTVPVLRGVAFESAKEAEAYLLSDNRLVEVGHWDMPELQISLSEIGNFEGVGFSQGYLDQLISSLNPEKHRGPTPADLLPGFVNAQIKQVVLLFSAEEYDEFVSRLDRVAKSAGLNSNTEVVAHLLAAYENSH